ncbi:acyl-coenzyme A thioesterase 13-like [Eriocheir sinensis]|uniref:acyl-coenzyme A thioesterase 13-like n=1 Tax=Eriocheir sinensis TaxID=95602 RepID=UPI0021C8A5CA|nr:acyl-coenzyme A thioesterase 13-like [Eriocheir sinensis]
MSAANGAKKLLQKVMKATIEAGGYDTQLTKLCLVSAGQGRCSATVKVDKEHTNRTGNLHGGFTATLVDAVSTLALMTAEGGSPGVSVNMNISYMKSAKIGEEILINAETLKLGKTMAFLDVDITNKDTGALVAKGSHTKFVG